MVFEEVEKRQLTTCDATPDLRSLNANLVGAHQGGRTLVFSRYGYGHRSSLRLALSLPCALSRARTASGVGAWPRAFKVSAAEAAKGVNSSGTLALAQSTAFQ